MLKITIFQTTVDTANGTAQGAFLKQAEAEDHIIAEIGQSREGFDAWCIAHRPEPAAAIHRFFAEHSRSEDWFLLKATDFDLCQDVARYDQCLDAMEVPPNGDDYNAVLKILRGSPFVAPTGKNR